MEFVFTSVGEALHEGECDLRYRVLREPLGYGRGDVAFPFEAESLHLVAVREGVVVGCVLFKPDGGTGGRLFQMAVDPEVQGQGLGRKLVIALEEHLAGEGVERIELHSRGYAIGFYERLGYTCFGEPYEEVGIPHRNMEKAL